MRLPDESHSLARRYRGARQVGSRQELEEGLRKRHEKSLVLARPDGLFLWVVYRNLLNWNNSKPRWRRDNGAGCLRRCFPKCCIIRSLQHRISPRFTPWTFHTHTRLDPSNVGSLFINVVVPAGGAGGAALFTEDLARRGKPAARAASGVLLQLIADFSAFTFS